MSTSIIKGICSSIPIRLLGIVGYENRMNDLVYCPPIIDNDELTVYFGGDVQDFTEIMNTNGSNKKYVEWNLENMAKNLNLSFPKSHVIVVRPSKMAYRTFACFKNFVPSSDYGVPEHIPTNNALKHLKKLLENLSLAELKSSINIKKLRIIGFSKGCVVLNQFLHEFNYFKDNSLKDEEMRNFINRIIEMYWIDGGHSGGKNTWITSNEILQCYAIIGIKTYIHLTPYQIQDNKRPWIKKEEKRFYTILNKLGVDIHRQIHFPYETPTLDKHFEVLNIFQEKTTDVN